MTRDTCWFRTFCLEDVIIKFVFVILRDNLLLRDNMQVVLGDMPESHCFNGLGIKGGGGALSTLAAVARSSIYGSDLMPNDSLVTEGRPVCHPLSDPIKKHKKYVGKRVNHHG